MDKSERRNLPITATAVDSSSPHSLVGAVLEPSQPLAQPNNGELERGNGREGFVPLNMKGKIRGILTCFAALTISLAAAAMAWSEREMQLHHLWIHPWQAVLDSATCLDMCARTRAEMGVPTCRSSEEVTTFHREKAANHFHPRKFA